MFQRERTWCGPHRYEGTIFWKERPAVPDVRDTDKPSDVLVSGLDWLTLNRVQFASKYMCRFLLGVELLATRRKEKLHTKIK